MTENTAKPSCSHRRFKLNGGRRKKCLDCGATWTTRPKKRGRKPEKKRISALAKTFVDKLTIVQQANRSPASVGALAKRHAKSLALLAERPWPHQTPDGSLIIVIDAIWFRRDEERHTVYLMGLRAVSEDTLHFLRPILRPGNESQKQWQEIVREIPEETRRRIKAIVSDSFAGAGGLAREHGWIFQRCQAHLLLRLEGLCGDNKYAVSWRDGRQETKRLAYALMNTAIEVKAEKIADQFFAMAQDRRCPKRLRRTILETLRSLHEFRACYLHPNLRLPATTNAVENANGRIRSLLNRSRGYRTPESLIRWVVGFLWFHPTVACRPKVATELRR